MEPSTDSLWEWLSRFPVVDIPRLYYFGSDPLANVEANAINSSEKEFFNESPSLPALLITNAQKPIQDR